MDLRSWIVLSALGAVGTLAYKAGGWTWGGIVDAVSVRVVVEEEEPYLWVTEWLAEQARRKTPRRLSVSESDTRRPGERRGPLESRAMFVPGKGDHVLWRRGRRIMVTMEEGRYVKKPAEHMSSWVPGAVVFRTVGRDPSVLRELILEAEYEYRERRSHVLSRYEVDRWGHWEQAGLDTGRSMDTVILPKGRAEEILSDLRRFLGARERYARVGVPYRRGYLFHGPPGTGKSSLARALATECMLNLYILPVSGLQDDTLREALGGVRSGSLVLLEDVEEATAERGDKGVTRSGLLNALDGVAAREDRVLVMTTNKRGALDEALVRAGRADVHVLLEHADSDQARRMFRRFFPGAEPVDAQLFGSMAAGSSPAEIQGHLLRHWDDATEALNTWSKT